MKKSRQSNFTFIPNEHNKILKAWDHGVPFEDAVYEQAAKCLSLPFVSAVCLMPDAHAGLGSTVGSVIVTENAVIPAAVGVDVGCGMSAYKTQFSRNDLENRHEEIFSKLSKYIPNGRTDNGGPKDIGRWQGQFGEQYSKYVWEEYFQKEYDELVSDIPFLGGGNSITYEQLGTLGTGNHFFEVCIDQNNEVWLVVHSGSRGIGARMAGYFMKRAKELCQMWHVPLIEKDLAYFPRGTEDFDLYIKAIYFLQRYAKMSRRIMLYCGSRTIDNILNATPNCYFVDNFNPTIDCHHNYLSIENHNGKNYYVTRKGAVRAREGDKGIIPGSMGAETHLTVGLGSNDSFCSSSHGAGRVMSRTKAKKNITLDQHIKDTDGVVCYKDDEILDESPRAYKSIRDVMEAQKDLVKTENILKQIICIKGK